MYDDRYIRSNLLTLYCSNVSNMVSSVVTSMSYGILIVTALPATDDDKDRIDAVQTSLDSHTGRPLKKQLKEVLRSTKFLYHPDRNRNVNLEMKDVEWELLSIEITKALNGFKIPGEEPVRDSPGKGKRKF